MISKQSYARGFTLIELLIVIAIIIFLAKLIAPRYSGLYAKARQTEVMLNLSSLFAAQQAYHIQHGRFTSNLRDLEWQPKGYTNNPETTQNAYTYSATSSGGTEGVSVFTGSSRTPATALSDSTVSTDNFTIKAALKNDAGTEVWVVDHTGDIKKETP